VVLFEEQFSNAFSQNWYPVVDHFPAVNVNSLISPTYAFTADGMGLNWRVPSTAAFQGSFLEASPIFGPGIDLTARFQTPSSDPSIGEIQFWIYIVNADTQVVQGGIGLHYGCWRVCKAVVTQGSGSNSNVNLNWNWGTWYRLEVFDSPNGTIVNVIADDGTLLFTSQVGPTLSTSGSRFRIGFGSFTGYDGGAVQSALVDYVRLCKSKC
jgi:hypothetical protein